MHAHLATRGLPKTEMDQEAWDAMYPQNALLATWRHLG
jgi:hypothetical protein